MDVLYTIQNDHIHISAPANGKILRHQELNPRLANDLQIYVNDSQEANISILNVQGKTPDEMNIRFSPSENSGYVACVQVVDNSSCLVFNSDRNFAMNYSPHIVDIRIMKGSVPFEYKYSESSLIRRMDIYMTVQVVKKHLNEQMLSVIEENEMIQLRSEHLNGLSTQVNNKMRLLMNAVLDQHSRNKLYQYATSFLDSINEFWKNKFL